MAGYNPGPGIFDISPPSRVVPTPTSRPVIVGHHPMMADPMVRSTNFVDQTPDATAVPVRIASDPTPAAVNSPFSAPMPAAASLPAMPDFAAMAPAAPQAPAESPVSAPAMPNFMTPPPAAPIVPTQPTPSLSAMGPPTPPPVNSFDPLQISPTQTPPTTTPPLASTPQSTPEMPQESENPAFSALLAEPNADDPVGLSKKDTPSSEQDEAMIGKDGQMPNILPMGDLNAMGNDKDKNPPKEGEPAAADQKPASDLADLMNTPHLPPTIGDSPTATGGKPFIFMVIFLAVAIGGYLAADAGVFGSSLKVPYHVFKQSTPLEPAIATVTPTVTPTAQAQPADTAPASGLTTYKLDSTPLNFSYPSAWGQVTTVTDKGFTSRSTNAKSDGTYAYLINFSVNKDVQLALSSSKYLPPTRTAPEYYDSLQWCNGTNDGKFYAQSLKFSSASGVDTPTTITCDQGPLADAAKVDALTIVRAKAKDSTGKVIGDVYTKNLADKEFSVVHVKDATSASAADIKKLLASLK